MRGEEGQGKERKRKAKRVEDGGRNGGKPIQVRTSNKVHGRQKGTSMLMDEATDSSDLDHGDQQCIRDSNSDTHTKTWPGFISPQ